MAEIEFDPDTYEPLPVYKPARHPRADRQGAGHARRGRAAADRRRRRHHQRRRRRAAGRVRRADRRAGRPDPDGLGHDPRRPPAERRHGRAADLAPLRQRDDAGSPTSSSASATAGPTGTPAASTPTRAGRTFVHVDIEPTQIGRVFAPDYGIVVRREGGAGAVRRGRAREAAGRCPTARRGPTQCQRAQAHPAAPHALRQRPDQAAAGLRGDEPRLRPGRRATSARSGCRRSPAAQLLHVYRPRHWINCRPGRPARLDACPAALGVRHGRPGQPRSSRCPATTTSSS